MGHLLGTYGKESHIFYPTPMHYEKCHYIQVVVGVVPQNDSFEKRGHLKEDNKMNYIFWNNSSMNHL